MAKAHVQALVVPEAGGERFTTSAGPFAAQDWCDVGHLLLPPYSFYHFQNPLGRNPYAMVANSRSSISDSPTFQMSLLDDLGLMISFVRFRSGIIASDPRVSSDWSILGGKRLSSKLSTACGIGSSFEVVHS